jgi:hypothetical protein
MESAGFSDVSQPTNAKSVRSKAMNESERI